jgi:hypothetical protein
MRKNPVLRAACLAPPVLIPVRASVERFPDHQKHLKSALKRMPRLVS